MKPLRYTSVVLPNASLSLLLLLLAAGACMRTEPQPAPTPAPAELAPAPAPPPAEDKLVVLAAASLREVFEALGDEFKRAHSGVEITFSFAGTQELRTQLEHGAAADVFASADQRHMEELVKAGHAAGPVVFARNEPVVVVAKDQVAKVKTFGDLPKAQRIVIGTPEVPIGRYTLQILGKANEKLGKDFQKKVEAHVASRELNVKQVLAKVTLGEGDAGIVYRTDAMTAKEQVGIVVIPPELNVIAEYPIAKVSEAAHPTLAQAWLDLVLSQAGQDRLKAAGFLSPAQAGR